jgi:flagellin
VAQDVTIDGETISLGTIAVDAKAIANAINSNVTGMTASANATEVAAGTSAVTATANGNSTVDINGLTITIAGTGNAATNRTNTVDAINAQSSVTGVIATDTGSGVSLAAADGRNITVANFAAGGNTAATIADFGLAAEATTGGTLDITYVAPSGVTGAVDFSASSTLTDQTIAATGTALSAIDISTANGATTALSAIDAALSTINGTRADLGAIQNRFESVVTSLQITAENLSASRSRIVDADFAVETANLTRAQILQQAGTAMLSQANAAPQNVLALLQ